MKYAILLFVFVTGGYCTLKYNGSKAIHTQLLETFIVYTRNETTPLRVVYFQDCSPSIRTNGVEIISSGVFAPFFENTHQSIELNVGFITNLTAKKLITLHLPAARFTKPMLVDFKDVIITDRKKVANDYQIKVRQYEADSVTFYSKRTKCINDFRAQVDTVLNKYQKKQSSSTDLTPVVEIADKTFNYSVIDGARNVLILNTDGIDSYHRKAKAMKNKATVILVNANSISHTALDAILTNNLQSSEQAIQFSLNQTKN